MDRVRIDMSVYAMYGRGTVVAILSLIVFYRVNNVEKKKTLTEC